MKKQLLTLLALLIAISSFSNPINEATAKRYAENFWKENRIMGVRNGKVFKKKAEEARFVNIATRGGYSEFYIFNNEIGKGFVIVSADNCVTPILGYSYDNNFVVENMPDNVKGWMDGYAEQIRYAVNARLAATDEIRENWRCLQECRHLPIKSETSVNPLLTTSWDQNDYYNMLCPYDPDGPGGHAYAGCVACAMAQIMNYWNWPICGTGSNYYNSNYGWIGANFCSTFYDWDNMPNSLTIGSPYQQKESIAELMYHCGVSVEMDYGPDSSGAYTTSSQNSVCSENALKDYFGYKNTLFSLKRRDYFDYQWIELLKSELNEHHPILYSGNKLFMNSGHAFVCDGYDVNDYFHFNWGWSGNANGFYYEINSLQPVGTSYNFNYWNEAVLGIVPEYAPNDYFLQLHHDVEMSQEEYWFFSNENISVYSEIINQGNAPFDGYIASLVFEENNGECILVDMIGYWDFTNDPLPPSYWSYGDMETESGLPYVPGFYYTVMAYSSDGDNWALVDEADYDMDGDFFISYSDVIETNSEFYTDILYQGQESEIGINVLNTGYSHFYGQFRIRIVELDGTFVQTLGILETDFDYTCGLIFSGTITAEPGVYFLELSYKPTGSDNWYYAGATNYPCMVRVSILEYPINADQYEVNNTLDQAYNLPANFSGNTAAINTNGSNFHNNLDIDYYKITLPSGYDYTISPRLHDSYNSGNGNTYTADGIFFYSTDGYNWSDYYDDVMSDNIYLEEGGIVYFYVGPYYEGSTGTYLLSMSISRTQHAPNTYQITATASPSSGGTVSGAGTYAQGETCMLTATANANYSFVNWTENGVQVSTNPNYSFTVTEDRTLVANFTYSPIMYTINATANPTVGGTINGTGQYASGETCTLIAIPNSEYIFTNWTENGTQVSTNASYSFTVTSNRNLVANFTYSPNVFTVTAVANPTNGGNVSGAGNYEAGQTCTLTASANTGFTFVNWTENGSQVSTNASYSFTVTGNRNLVANFTQNSYIVTVSANPSNGGTATGSGTYNYGQNCTVSASPNNGFAFTNWTENGTQVSTNATYSFTVNGNRNLVANFAQNVHTITATAGANGSISPSGAVSVANGGSQTFEMIPNSGYAVFEIYVDGNLVGSMTSFTFNNVVADHSIFVTFQHIDGLGENMNNEIVIYPNPTNGILNVQCSEIDEIRVYNAYGVLIDKAKTNGKELIQIDLSNASAGVFLMQAIRNDESISKVFIKE